MLGAPHPCSSYVVAVQSLSCVWLPVDHGLQHARLPWVHSNSCPLSWWCHPTISFSVAPFSFCPQSFPASESFPVSRLFASGGQTIGASASAPVLSVEIQGCFPLGLTSLLSFLSKELLSKSFPAPQFEGINSSALSLFYCPALTSMHDYWKNHSFN